jgi:hypothetical protein
VLLGNPGAVAIRKTAGFLVMADRSMPVAANRKKTRCGNQRKVA